MLVVRGTHKGQEYDVAYCDTQIEAGAAKRREEHNNHYEHLTIVDLDDWALREYLQLDRDELTRRAGLGDPVAREALGMPVDEQTDEELQAQIDRLTEQLTKRNPPPPPEPSPFVDTPATPPKTRSRKDGA